MKKLILSSVLLGLLFTGNLFAQDQEDALVLYKQGNYEKAVDVCKKEIEKNPSRLDSFVVMGWALLKLNKYQDIITLSDQAFKINRYDNRMVEIVGEANFFLGKNKESLNFFEEYLSLPGSADRVDVVYYYMGEIYIRLGEFNHADIAFSTAVYHAPNSARWWARLGYAREMSEDYKGAQSAYEKALQITPGLDDAKRGKDRVTQKIGG